MYQTGFSSSLVRVDKIREPGNEAIKTTAQVVVHVCGGGGGREERWRNGNIFVWECCKLAGFFYG